MLMHLAINIHVLMKSMTGINQCTDTLCTQNYKAIVQDNIFKVRHNFLFFSLHVTSGHYKSIPKKQCIIHSLFVYVIPQSSAILSTNHSNNNRKFKGWSYIATVDMAFTLATIARQLHCCYASGRLSLCNTSCQVRHMHPLKTHHYFSQSD